MGIDVNEARIRAGQLTQYKVWLESSRRMMGEYKNQINANWSGMEVAHINIAISQVISSLDQVIRELDGISMDVVRAANEIQAEEQERERQKKLEETEKDDSIWQSHMNSLHR